MKPQTLTRNSHKPVLPPTDKLPALTTHLRSLFLLPLSWGLTLAWILNDVYRSRSAQRTPGKYKPNRKTSQGASS